MVPAGLRALWGGLLIVPDLARALCLGTLDQMVDQVTRSVAFIQKQYPCTECVSPQTLVGRLGRKTVGKVNAKPAPCLPHSGGSICVDTLLEPTWPA